MFLRVRSGCKAVQVYVGVCIYVYVYARDSRGSAHVTLPPRKLVIPSASLEVVNKCIANVCTCSAPYTQTQYTTRVARKTAFVF